MQAVLEKGMTVTGSLAVARLVATLTVGAVVGIGAVLVVRGPTPSAEVFAEPTARATLVGPAELAAAHAYLDVIRPVATEAGRIVQDGMKPAITTLQDPDGDHASLVGRASTWIGAFASTQQAWSQTTPPPALHDAHVLFLTALAEYAEVADRLARATTDDARRSALVDEAIELGTAADDVYDQAAQIVQAHLMAGGEDPAVWLPLPDEG
jgi:hypothetical protein